MPDVWTNNPEKLRRMLDRNEIDISCGGAPRVILDRDPAWTCHLAWNEPGTAWIGDVYIHDIRDFLWAPHSPVWTVTVVALMVGLVLGLLVGKRVALRGE